jgi:hypothetical protein
VTTPIAKIRNTALIKVGDGTHLLAPVESWSVPIRSQE